MGSKTTWRREITERMEENGETWTDVVATTLTVLDMDREFYDDFGACEGRPFTLWTRRRVYFPVCYDGAEWVRSVPRDPCDEMTRHAGGGGGYTARDANGEYLEDEHGEPLEPGVER
jgi:hypothetical protein